MKPQWHTGAGNEDKGQRSVIVETRQDLRTGIRRCRVFLPSSFHICQIVCSNLVQGGYSETGFHIGMDRNFVCFMAQTQLQLVSPFLR